MIYKIMDVNAGGETVARIESNNGKNALRRFRRLLLAPGAYEIKRGYFRQEFEEKSFWIFHGCRA